MSFKIDNIIEIMEEIAPLELRESYDNVGFMVGNRELEVTKILLALDCTLEVIEEAKIIGAELILTHHPLLYKKPSTITTDTLQGRKITELIKNNIALYSAHTNWDSVKNGLNDEFVKLLGFNAGEIIEANPLASTAGVGRLIKLKEELTVEEIIDIIKEKLNVTAVRFTGNINNIVKTISIVNGSGEDYLEKSYSLGAELMITGDTTYHYVSDYSEMGLQVIDVGHFNSEWPVVVELSKVIKEIVEPMGVEIILSKVVHDPYNFV